MKITVIIPAYNEQERIGETLDVYCNYFEQNRTIDFQILTVLNACTDRTEDVVAAKKQRYSNVELIKLNDKGKGLAIRKGFAKALNSDSDLIGFVDADMSTKPSAYLDLIKNIGNYDGIIASRYMADSIIDSPRPLIKRLGSKYTYELLARRLLNLHFSDLQCGAKLFKRNAISAVISKLTVTQWAFDIELLYLLQKNNMKIREIPTIWHDQPGSKLVMLKDGLRMINTILKVKRHHKSTFNS